MAYIADEKYFSVWWPGPLPDDLEAGSYLDFMDPELQEPDEHEPPAQSLFGYIIRDWFGPFLLSPPARSSRGQC
jgi:hypothetical protein